MAEDLVVNVRVQGTDRAKGQIESLGASASNTGKVAGLAMGPLDAVMGGLPSKFKAAKAGVQSLNLGFKGMKAAIASTGIGLLVVAIGELVANWDSITGYLNSATSETQKQVDLAREYTTETRLALENITSTENILKLQGKSEEQILAMKMAATDEALAAQKILIATLKQQQEEQLKAAQTSSKYAQAIVQMISSPLTAVLFAIDKISIGLEKLGLIEERLTLRTDFAEGMAEMLGFDPEAVAAEGEKTIREAEDTLTQLENQRAGHELRVQAIEQSRRDEATKQAEQAEADRQARTEAEQAALEAQAAAEDRVRQELEESRMTDRQKQEASLQAHYDKLAEQAGENADLIAQVEAQREADLNAMRERFRQEDEANAERKRLRELTGADDQRQRELEAEREYQENLAALKETAMSSTFGILGNLSKAFEKDTEEGQKKAFQRNKAISIAETLVSTYQAAQKAYASQLAIPTPDAPLRAQIAAGIAVASGLAQVAAIKSTQFKSASAAGTAGSAGSIRGGIQSVGVDVGTLVPTTGQPTPEPVRAYVVSNEISNKQALDRELQIQTTL